MNHKTDAAPHYLVIFRTKRSGTFDEYQEVAQALANAVKDFPGFLGIETVVDDRGNGISISRWSSLEAIRHWKEDPQHAVAQRRGQKEWYDHYTVQVCRIEREYHGGAKTELKGD